jgi:phosphate transport system protein
MRAKFDNQLEILNTDLIEMGALCEEAISFAVKALIANDKTLAYKAIETEKRIDDKEREIEGLCLKLLLQQQPVAKDLRQISSALKMITDMERIGDQAADIAEIVTFIDLTEGRKYVHIPEMTEAAIAMVTDSINAFVRRDIEQARAVINNDDIVDNLFNRIKKELCTLIAREPEIGEQVIDILMIAKYLERIGDHATNIAGWVEFSITGEHPQFSDLKSPEQNRPAHTGEN